MTKYWVVGASWGGVDHQDKRFVESIQSRVVSFDPFLIKNAIMEATTNGSIDSLRSLVSEFDILDDPISSFDSIFKV